MEHTCGRYGSYCGVNGYQSSWDKFDRYFDKKEKKSESKKNALSSSSLATTVLEDDYDNWYNSEEYWKDRLPF